MSGWTIEKTITFEASHVLLEHDGKCARLHGHSWKAHLIFQGDELHSSGPERGMLIDFNVIKKYATPMVDEYLDHHHLNETLAIYPTSEKVATWIYGQLEMLLPDQYARLFVGVRVEETCTSAATYRPANPGRGSVA
jgi:6-pyruvoyltetrahydropterin/6-carboxytetrahydropterin synthase